MQQKHPGNLIGPLGLKKHQIIFSVPNVLFLSANLNFLYFQWDTYLRINLIADLKIKPHEKNEEEFEENGHRIQQRKRLLLIFICEVCSFLHIYLASHKNKTQNITKM